MKTIELTQGKVAIVDDEMFDYLNQWKWSYVHGYAVRAANNKHVYMHRVILMPEDGKECDHIDRDPLNNTRVNLRECTGAENRCNIGPRRDNTSGYRGVSYACKRWQASITVNGRQLYLGKYLNAKDAALAYDRAAIKYHGEFAFLNKMILEDENVKS